MNLTPNSPISQIVSSLNYVLATSNNNTYGNSDVSVYLPTDPVISNIQSNVNYTAQNALFANPNTGEIATVAWGNTISYLYRNIHFAYANSIDGSQGFSTTDYANKQFYGVRNTNSQTESTNPTDYVWYQVADGGFSTTKKLWYITIGTNNISITISDTRPNQFYRLADNVDFVDLYEASVIVIPDDFITNQKILDNEITGSKISLNTLTNDLFVAETILANSIAKGNLTGDLFAENTITGNLIANQTITGNLIALNTISGNNIIANSITGDKITANTIYGNSIVAGSITATELQTGLLDVGNITSFNATIGDYNSPGYWLDYTTGNVRLGGNVSIGGNTSIQGLLTAGNLIAGAIDTTALAFRAVSQTIETRYQSPSDVLNMDGTRYYKMPKLKGWQNLASDSDEYSMILSATITPSSNESVIKVDFSTYYNNDTASNYGSVALFRSQHEGKDNLNFAGNKYNPYMLYNFKSVDILLPDEQSQGSYSKTYIAVSGYENIATEFNNRDTLSNIRILTLSFNSNGIVVDSAISANSSPWQTNSWGYDLSQSHPKHDCPIVGYYNSGTAYYSLPNQTLPDAAYITSTAKTPYADSGYTNTHGMLVATRLGGTYFNGNSVIYQTAEISGNVWAAPELSINDGSFTRVETNTPPWVSSDFVISALAVGDNAIIYKNTSRIYGQDGVLDGQNGWYGLSLYSNNTLYEKYTGNLYGCSSSSNSTEYMSISSYQAGAGKDSNSSNSNMWVVVGERGGIFYESFGQGTSWFQPVLAVPHQLRGITLRAICYDHYRYRWWAVGDSGTIIYANDRSDKQLVWNTYNSGTTRTLYDIKFDPVSAKWVAVGDGIIIIDDGQTLINGQRVYPHSTYAYDVCAGQYTTFPNTPDSVLNYEPYPVVVYKGFQNGYIFNGFTEHDENLAQPSLFYDTFTTQVSLSPGSVISGSYIENTDQQQNARINGHVEGVPITFYLMVGAPTGSNVIVGSPTLTITEYKR